MGYTKFITIYKDEKDNFAMKTHEEYDFKVLSDALIGSLCIVLKEAANKGMS